jgi:hypothetical protein
MSRAAFRDLSLGVVFAENRYVAALWTYRAGFCRGDLAQSCWLKASNTVAGGPSVACTPGAEIPQLQAAQAQAA